MRRFTLALAATTMAIPVAMTVPAASASAAVDMDDQRRYYGRDGSYRGPTWRGRDGRYRCRRSNGTTGLLIGGAAGALIGNQVAGGVLGPVIGGVAGALVGREVDRRESGYRDNRGRRCR